MKKGDGERGAFWSNCFVEALKAHWRDPVNTSVICLTSIRGEHYLWEHLPTGKVYHFTNRGMNGRRVGCRVLFRGRVEEIEGKRKRRLFERLEGK